MIRGPDGRFITRGDELTTWLPHRVSGETDIRNAVGGVMNQEQSAHDMVDPHSLPNGCTDEAVQCAALRRLVKDVCRWLGGDNRDDVDIYKELERCAARDGYEFARNLEQQCGWWYCTAQLVGILNRYGQYLDEARDIATRECLECNGNAN